MVDKWSRIYSFFFLDIIIAITMKLGGFFEVDQAKQPSDSESNPHIGGYQECQDCETIFNKVFFGVTIRPNENYNFTVGSQRKKYKDYDLDAQRLILDRIVSQCSRQKAPLYDIHYEVSELAGQQLMHLHCFFKCTEDATYDALKSVSLDVNKKCGPRTYTSFDYRILVTHKDRADWHSYIRKYDKLGH